MLICQQHSSAFSPWTSEVAHETEGNIFLPNKQLNSTFRWKRPPRQLCCAGDSLELLLNQWVDPPGKTGWETLLKHIVTAGVGSHLPSLSQPASSVAGRHCCAAVLQKPALPSRLQLGYSQQKFICLIRGKYVRTSTEMKFCWVGVGLKLVFCAQDFVERAERQGCRQVTTCRVSPVRCLYSRNCLQQKKK